MSNSCNKTHHLYQRYYCEECKTFHKRDDQLYLKHADYKVNRYFCSECGFTHIASHGEQFLKHFKYKIKEISYYSRACGIKCLYKGWYDINLSDKDAKELEKLNMMRIPLYTHENTIHRLNKYNIILKYTIPNGLIPIPKLFYLDLKREIVVNRRLELKLKILIYKDYILNHITNKKTKKEIENKIRNYEIELLNRRSKKRGFHLKFINNNHCVKCNEEINEPNNHYTFDYNGLLDILKLRVYFKPIHTKCQR